MREIHHFIQLVHLSSSAINRRLLKWEAKVSLKSPFRKRNPQQYGKHAKRREMQVFWKEIMRIRDHGPHIMWIELRLLSQRNYFLEKSMRRMGCNRRYMKVR